MCVRPRPTHAHESGRVVYGGKCRAREKSAIEIRRWFFRGERFDEFFAAVIINELPAIYTSERKGCFNERTHRHSPYYTPDYCIAWFIDLCLLRTLSTIILCSLYLVFIFLRGGLAARRTPRRRSRGCPSRPIIGSLPPLLSSPSFRRFPLPRWDRRRQRDAPIRIRSCKLSLHCVIYRDFRKLLHPVRTLYVVCEVAFVLVCVRIVIRVYCRRGRGRFERVGNETPSAEVPRPVSVAVFSHTTSPRERSVLLFDKNEEKRDARDTGRVQNVSAVERSRREFFAENRRSYEP